MPGDDFLNYIGKLEKMFQLATTLKKNRVCRVCLCYYKNDPLMVNVKCACQLCQS
jgi:hypothetical protein